MSKITLGIELLRKINLVKYTWKIDQDKRLYDGVLAQELYEIYPSAVTVGEDVLGEDGSLKHPWNVDYSKLVPVTMKSVQELDAKIVELEDTVKYLQEQLAAVLAKLS